VRIAGNELVSEPHCEGSGSETTPHTDVDFDQKIWAGLTQAGPNFTAHVQYI